MAEAKDYVNEIRWAVTTLSLLLFVGIAIHSERNLLSSDLQSAGTYLLGHHALSVRLKDVRLSSSAPSNDMEMDQSLWAGVVQKAGDVGLIEWLGPEMSSGRMPLTKISFLTNVSGFGEVILVIQRAPDNPPAAGFAGAVSANKGKSPETSEAYNLSITAADANAEASRRMFDRDLVFRVSNAKVIWKDGFFMYGQGRPIIFLPSDEGREVSFAEAELLPRLMATALRWGVTSNDPIQAYYQLRSRYEAQRVRLPLVQTDVIASYAVAILAGLAVGAGSWLSLMLSRLTEIEAKEIIEHWTVLDALVRARTLAGLSRFIHIAHFVVLGLFYSVALIAPLGIPALAWIERVEGDWFLNALLLSLVTLGSVFSASALKSGAAIILAVYRSARPR
ncbi:MAG TPA: hypothetical protein VGS07_34135 [Thermoanaerobaculia bacterium]|jgi:hypothetical protein|nr:hypothetical protein [Thermoanaerobaculia bacterium]